MADPGMVEVGKIDLEIQECNSRVQQWILAFPYNWMSLTSWIDTFWPLASVQIFTRVYFKALKLRNFEILLIPKTSPPPENNFLSMFFSMFFRATGDSCDLQTIIDVSRLITWRTTPPNCRCVDVFVFQSDDVLKNRWVATKFRTVSFLYLTIR